MKSRTSAMPQSRGFRSPRYRYIIYNVRAHGGALASFYGSSCANNGKGALNTPDGAQLVYTRASFALTREVNMPREN
eukprot:1179817-Prorocentrum_minimum.AAC.2